MKGGVSISWECTFEEDVNVTPDLVVATEDFILREFSESLLKGTESMLNEMTEVYVEDPTGFVIFSPDGFPIERDKSWKQEEIDKAINNFVERFRAQGYYSSMNGRLNLDQIKNYCYVEQLTREVQVKLKIERR